LIAARLKTADDVVLKVDGNLVQVAVRLDLLKNSKRPAGGGARLNAMCARSLQAMEVSRADLLPSLITAPTKWIPHYGII
jgi:hypothetical protein